MRVLVAGAAGAIGQRLVPALVAAGHAVVATTRSRAKIEGLRVLGSDAVVLDGLDAVAVGEAVGRAAPDVIVHQMTALAGMGGNLRNFDRHFATTNELRTAGTHHLLAAAAASGVPRFVAQSFTGWPNTRTGGRVKTEQDSLDGAPPDAQRRTLSAIRYLERAVTHAPLHGTVLRYGLLYGPGASEKFAEMILAGKFPLVGAGTGVWSFAHVDDATSMTPRRRRWQRSSTGHRCLRRRRRRTRRGGGVAAVPRAGPRCTRAAAPAGLAGQAGRG